MIETIIIKSIKITHEIVNFIVKYYHKFYFSTKTLFNTFYNDYCIPTKNFAIKCYSKFWIPTKNFVIKFSKHKYVSKSIIKLHKYRPFIFTGFSYFNLSYPCYLYYYGL